MQKIIIYLFLFCALLFTATAYGQTKQVGKATYYGNKWHGRKTSSGKVYHRDSFTCAHRTYPFGTILKVHDLNTGKEVCVEVTDRGPFVKGRVIDLSYAAAKELGMISRGVSRVEILKVEDDDRIPYKIENVMGIPRLEVKSPDGNGYCLLSEWAEKNQRLQEQKLMSKSSGNKKVQVGVSSLNKDSVPRWKIFDKLSAQTEPVEKNEFRYLLKQ